MFQYMRERREWMTKEQAPEVPVRFYRSATGREPVLEWLRSLDRDYKMTKRSKHTGSSLDDFLKEEGILEETRAIALKEAVAWQVQQAMEKEKITKVEMARRMDTSRAALDRLLAPGNASVTLQTLTRAARHWP
jgi:antitoxin HicB